MSAQTTNDETIQQLAPAHWSTFASVEQTGFERPDPTHTQPTPHLANDAVDRLRSNERSASSAAATAAATTAAAVWSTYATAASQIT